SFHESTGVNHSNQRGDVTKAQGRYQPGLRWGRTQIQLLAQPCQVSVLAQRRVHTVQRAVRWQYTVAQNLGEANQLEGCGTALGVTGQGLLRDDKQRVARITAHGRCDSLMQIRLI